MLRIQVSKSGQVSGAKSSNPRLGPGRLAPAGPPPTPHKATGCRRHPTQPPPWAATPDMVERENDALTNMPPRSYGS